MRSAATARAQAQQFDALAREVPGPAAVAARRRACELRLEALLLREPPAKNRGLNDPATSGDPGHTTPPEQGPNPV